MVANPDLGERRILLSSSFQFSYSIYVSLSLIINSMTAAWQLRIRNISVFSRPENCPSVSNVVLISGGRLFHANGPATDMLRGPKPAALVRDTTRSP